jgi:hypothetical protein
VPALHQKNPHQWMLSHLGLASSYQRRQAGNRDENDERCVEHAREGLAVDTMVTDLDAWTDLHVILAYRYPERKGGDRNENLNAAVEHAETALRVRRRGTGDGTAWADVQRLLGPTLVALGKYKRALAPLKLALEVFTLDRSPRVLCRRPPAPGQLLPAPGRFLAGHRARPPGARPLGPRLPAPHVHERRGKEKKKEGGKREKKRKKKGGKKGKGT